MKFLHTSDWHLGITMQGASCEEEHRLFLDWLIETISADEVDVLLVAGDIFHRDQPPAKALKIYYQFLARCTQETKLSQVVVVGGNHDSPTRLEAPADILAAQKVHVVGGLTVDEESWEQCICPVKNRNTGAVEAVVVAVPYVQEAKLGVITTSASESEIREQYRERFTYLYESLASRAQADYPEVPLIATGHLTCSTKNDKLTRQDYPEEIHQVGTISGLPPTIFGDAYDYIALGHIHRQFPLGDSHAWYCGTPVATSQTEATKRYILMTDTDQRDEDGQLIVEKKEVPIWRDVEVLSGTKDFITEVILDMPRDWDLTPYLFLDVELESVDDIYAIRTYFDSLVRDTFKEGKKPRIIEYREHLPPALQMASESGEPEDIRGLEEMTPEEVFTRLFKETHEGQPPSQTFLVAFRYLMESAGNRNVDDEGSPILFEPEPEHEHQHEPEHENEPKELQGELL